MEPPPVPPLPRWSFHASPPTPCPSSLADHDSLAGIVRFAAEAQRHNLPAIIGAEVTVGSSGSHSGDRPHLVLLAESLAGYQSLCALLTYSYREGGKDDPYVPFDVLAKHT